MPDQLPHIHMTEFRRKEPKEPVAYQQTTVNKLRAGLGACAMGAYIECKEEGAYVNDWSETILGDLLCDLRHFAAVNGIDFNETLARSKVRFDDDASGEE